MNLSIPTTVTVVEMSPETFAEALALLRVHVAVFQTLDEHLKRGKYIDPDYPHLCAEETIEFLRKVGQTVPAW